MAATCCGESWHIMWKLNERACGRAARSLGEYLDGTLPLARRRAVEAHLHACAGCRRELEAMRRTLALLSGLPRRELTGDFDAALQARLEEVKGVGRRVSGVGSDRSDPTTDRRRPMPDARRARHYLRAPWPSPLRRLAPAGALAAVTLGMVAWRLAPRGDAGPSHVAATHGAGLRAGVGGRAPVAPHDVGPERDGGEPQPGE